MAEKRLTKAQRARLIPSDLRERISAMSDDDVLAVHDLTHKIMEDRTGTGRRQAAEEIMTDQSKRIGGWVHD